jgi:YVTN family beta-propeller protein
LVSIWVEMKLKSFICFCGLYALVGFNSVFLAGQSRAENFAATTETVGPNSNGFETPVNQLVTPAGTLIELPGIRPNALALNPDGQRLVTAGLTQRLVVIDPATGKILQRVRLPADDKLPTSEPTSSSILQPDEAAKLSFTGLVFSPDGSRIYLANVNGDIKVIGVDPDHRVTPLFSIPLPPANASGRQAEIPAGIAVSPDGKKLYVAGNLSNRLIELDAATGKVLQTWDVGVAPFDVVLVGRKIYVSNWGGRRPDADSVTGPAGDGTRARVDARSIANEGSVSVIDLSLGSAGILPASALTEHAAETAALPVKEILTGLHACALALSPDGRWLVVANAGSDTLSVIDTRTDKIVETICARQNPADLFGAQPNALAFDRSGKTLFVCNGTQNAVAVFHFKPGESRLLGLIPVGWFPGSIAYDAKQKKIYVANIKSISPDMQKAVKGLGNSPGFNTRQYDGSLSLVPVPSKRELAAHTKTALADLGYPLLVQAALPARADQPARPVPERVGEPSVFHHVIYIIKENRAGAVGVSGPATEVANPARRSWVAAATRATGAADENKNRGEAGGKPSVAAAGRGSRAEVLARDQGSGARGAAGGVGPRSASATLRPPCVPHRQPGKPNNKPQPTKGTFSRELRRGHF